MLPGSSRPHRGHDERHHRESSSRRRHDRLGPGSKSSGEVGDYLVEDIVEVFIDAMDRGKDYRTDASAHGGAQAGGRWASACSGVPTAMFV